MTEPCFGRIPAVGVEERNSLWKTFVEMGKRQEGVACSEVNSRQQPHCSMLSIEVAN